MSEGGLLHVAATMVAVIVATEIRNSDGVNMGFIVEYWITPTCIYKV